MLMPTPKIFVAILGASLCAWLAIIVGMLAGGAPGAIKIVVCGIVFILILCAVLSLWLAASAQLKRERKTLGRQTSRLASNTLTEFQRARQSVSSGVVSLEEDIQLLRKNVDALRTDLLASKQSISSGVVSLEEDIQLLRKNVDALRTSLLSSKKDIVASQDRSQQTLVDLLTKQHKQNQDSHNLQVRKIIQHLRADANMPQVLDRLIALERRLIGALASGNADQTEELSSLFDASSHLQQRTAEVLESMAKRTNATAETFGRDTLSSLRELRKDISRVADHVESYRKLAEGVASSHRDELSQLQALLATQTDDLVSAVSSIDDGYAKREKDSDDRLLETLKSELGSLDDNIAKKLRDVTGRVGDSTQRCVKRHSIDVVKQTEALANLRSLVPQVVGPLPSLGGWALTADTMLYLYEYIRNNKPKRILEIGSGSSTIWLGVLARETGGELVSVEHSPQFGAVTRELIRKFDLNSVVDLRVAPIATVEIEDESYKWYDTTYLMDIGRDFDMLVIDGPPESTGSLARYPALPILYDRLATNCAVLLDDIHRSDERAILDEWLKSYPNFREVFTGLARSSVIVRE